MSTAQETENLDFAGLRVLAFESRRASEMKMLIETAHGKATLAFAMREVPLQDTSHIKLFCDALLEGTFDIVIFLTGSGVRTLAAALDNHAARKRWIKAMSRAQIVTRAPNVGIAVAELGLSVSLSVPPPHTWRATLTALDAHADQFFLKGARLALQEYGLPSRPFVKALKARGADVTRVPLYHWALPEEIGPLLVAIDDIVEGRHDVALFTNGTQVWHLFKLAYRKGMEEELRAGFSRLLVASIGPSTSEALHEFEVPIDFTPSQANMETFVSESAAQCHQLLAAKRAAKRAASPTS
ncbi:MAG TPA: uroporphyrinogen-III synthase [Abditibacteriaceae bacterium]